ncbi:MAG TPA: apolipoprotein N-acyltransferase [Acidimicrobiales bacterium]|nr:apolipoprotein N-acyltransferase [Acidimicrobiales bacterium]
MPRTARLVLSSLAAGGLVALSVPPWGFWPLAFAGTALLALTLHGLAGRPRSRALVGLLFGLGLFGPTLFWIREFHAVGFVALLLLEGSFFVAAALLTRRIEVLPATYLLAEWARGVVPFGGLPMGGLPLGQVTGPLAPVARLGGAYLLTGAAVAVGVAVVSAGRRRWRAALALLVAPVGLAAVGWVAPDGRDTGERLDVAIVQGGGPRGFRAVDSDPADVLEAHLAVSEGLRRPLDLVLWPENTIDVDAIDDSDEAAALSAVAERLGATVVAGVTEDAGDDGFQNVAVAWAPDGRIVDRYVKAHRVPFGEYVPLRGLLERLVDLSVLPRDAVAGDEAGLLRTPAGDLGVAISYEVFFGERGRAATIAGGRLLLVPTNAASFTTSQVPTQEIASAQLRAWETGRWVLMSAPTGYGAVLDHRGRLLARTTLSRAELLEGTAPLRTGRTVYTVLGDGPIVLAAALWLVLLVSRGRGRRPGGWSWPPRRGGGRTASASARTSPGPPR